MSDKIAWAAGLFEGEGCSSWNNRNKRISLQLATTDEDVVLRFKRAIGNIGIVNGPYQPKNPKAKLDQMLAFHGYRDNF